MDEKNLHNLASRIWDNDATYRGQLEEVRAITRQRTASEYALNGKMMSAAPSPRGLANIQMFASFPELLPRVMIPPIINKEKEDEKATNIERFIRGIRRATKYGDIHPDDAFWVHYAESGRGILYAQFDVACARNGEFPFVREAVDPLTFAFKASGRGLMYAVRSVMRDTLELYDELAGTYAEVEENNPEWSIPAILREAYARADSFPVTVMQMWDREREYMWVGDECVWKFQDDYGRPHLMGRVPFDVGFCVQMPSDRPEELGMGIIRPVLENLKNESKMMSKAYNGFNYFFMPLVAMHDDMGNVFFEQMVPGGQGYKQIKNFNVINPQVNAPMMEQLLSHNNDDINRASLSETTFGDSGRALSGFAYSQVNAGPARRNARLLDGGTEAYKQHFNMILNRVAAYANAEAAAEFGIESDDVATYLDAFATFTPIRTNPNKELRIKVLLTSKDVAEYQIVDLDFKPEAPEDANAKYQRAQLSKTIGMPQEYIDREVLKVDSPEQVAQWRKEEMLMQDPQWQARILEMWKRQKLEQDRDLAKEFQEQDLAQLPPELQQVVRDAMAQGATFGEAMDYVEQFLPQTQGEAQDTGQEGMPGEMGQDMQGQGPMMQGQPPMQPQQDPLAQIMAMLPPELQQVFQDPAVQQALMQMIQQGMSPDQAVEQIIQMLQGAPQQLQQPQGVGAGFVSPAQQGQMPVPPNQVAAMGGF